MLKNNKPLPLVLLTLFTFLFVILIFKRLPLTGGKNNINYKYDNNIYNRRLLVGELELKVDIASNEQEARLGLSGRERMCEICGMYFDLGYEDTVPTFWMKSMKFPIDIIWIDNGKIVGIERNAPSLDPNTPDVDLPTYRPPQKIDNVLEVNSGYSERAGINVGDNVTLLKDQ